MFREPQVTPLKKISKKKAVEIMQRVLGDWHVVDLPHEEMLLVWNVLSERKPYHESASLHVTEERYRLNGKTYHVYWHVGDLSKLPGSIGVRENYEWAKKKRQVSSPSKESQPSR